MKRVLAGLLALSLVGLVGCGGGTKTGDDPAAGSSGDKTIKIGFIGPLSGNVKTYGESAKEGFELALKQAGYKAGEFTIEAKVEDDRNDATEAINLANKLMDVEGVKAIVGPVTSAPAIAVTPILNEAGVVMITGTATAPAVTVSDSGERWPFTFRACFIDPFQGSIAAQFALNTLEAKTAAILYDRGNDYTVGQANSFKEAFEAGGGQIVAFESYAQSDTDFSAIMTSVAAKKPDMLYLPDYYNKVSLIGKAAKAKGLDVPMIGGDGWDSTDLDFETMAGNYFTAHYSSDDPRPEVQEFVAAYEAEYGYKPAAFAALAYDATNMLLEAIKQAGTDDPEQIRQALQNLKDFPAVGGKLHFDEYGNPVKGATILKVKADGTYEFVETIQP